VARSLYRVCLCREQLAVQRFLKFPIEFLYVLERTH